MCEKAHHFKTEILKATKHSLIFTLVNTHKHAAWVPYFGKRNLYWLSGASMSVAVWQPWCSATLTLALQRDPNHKPIPTSQRGLDEYTHHTHTKYRGRVLENENEWGFSVTLSSLPPLLIIRAWKGTQSSAGTRRLVGGERLLQRWATTPLHMTLLSLGNWSDNWTVTWLKKHLMYFSGKIPRNFVMFNKRHFSIYSSHNIVSRFPALAVCMFSYFAELN